MGRFFTILSLNHFNNTSTTFQSLNFYKGVDETLSWAKWHLRLTMLRNRLIVGSSLGWLSNRLQSEMKELCFIRCQFLPRNRAYYNWSIVIHGLLVAVSYRNDVLHFFTFAKSVLLSYLINNIVTITRVRGWSQVAHRSLTIKWSRTPCTRSFTSFSKLTLFLYLYFRNSFQTCLVFIWTRTVGVKFETQKNPKKQHRL